MTEMNDDTFDPLIREKVEVNDLAAGVFWIAFMWYGAEPGEDVAQDRWLWTIDNLREVAQNLWDAKTLQEIDGYGAMVAEVRKQLDQWFDEEE